MRAQAQLEAALTETAALEAALRSQRAKAKFLGKRACAACALLSVRKAASWTGSRSESASRAPGAAVEARADCKGRLGLHAPQQGSCSESNIIKTS